LAVFVLGVPLTASVSLLLLAGLGVVISLYALPSLAGIGWAMLGYALWSEAGKGVEHRPAPAR
jgi:hypothetical protein